MKLGKNILKIITVATLLVGSISIVFPNTASADLGDPNDLFIVQSPYPNTRVKGNVTISLRIFDNDQSQVQYQAGIFDAATCRTSHYGNVNPSTHATSHPVQSTIFNWNTAATQAISSLPDGDYCLKICAYFLNGTSPYSACNGRNLTIVNSNTPPVISSTPQSLQVSSGASFSYQIQASDPDSDALRYRLVAAPAGFSINPNTGLVNSVALTAPANTNVQYSLSVAVGDNISGEATQSFIVIVTGPVEQQPGTPDQGGQQPDNGEQPDEETPSGEEPEEPVASFITPNDQSVFTDEFNLIKWEIDTEGITEITLEYSADLENWDTIGDPFPPTRDYYLWDITGLKDGEYYLRLGITDEDGDTTYITSESFELARDISNDPDQIESSPLIVNITPESEEELLLEDLTISGEFVPSQDSEILPDTFSISLNDNDITDSCTVDATGFICEIPEDLEPGLHSLSVNIDDSSEQTATIEWTFTITDPNDEVPSEDDDEEQSDSDEEMITVFGREIPRSGFILMLIILCAGAALLIIPWILYAIWSRDNDEPIRETTTPPDNSGSSVTTTTTITPNESGMNQKDSAVNDTSYTEMIGSYQPDTAYDLNAAGSDYSYNEPTPVNTNTVIDYQMPEYKASDSTNQDASTDVYEQASPQQQYSDYGMPTTNLSKPVEPSAEPVTDTNNLANSIDPYTTTPSQEAPQSSPEPVGQIDQAAQSETVTNTQGTDTTLAPEVQTEPSQTITQQTTQYPDLSQVDFQIPNIDMGGQQPFDVTQQQVNSAVEETQPQAAGTTEQTTNTPPTEQQTPIQDTAQSQSQGTDENNNQTPPDSIDQYTEPPKQV